MIHQGKAAHSACRSTSNSRAAGKRRFGNVLRALGLMLVFTAMPGQAQTAAPNVVAGFTMSFFNLSGPTGTPYAGSTEGPFTLAPTAGSWFQSTLYGSPAPSIFDGPTNNPGIGVLLLTAAGSPFTFGSVDYSSNNGDSSYDIQGYLGANKVFDENGTLAGSISPFSFKTLLSSSSSVPIDGLLIEVIPGAGVTSLNLDNVRLLLVPEPGGTLLLGVGLMVLFARGALHRSRKQPE
jgi:hypothetical protein